MQRRNRDQFTAVETDQCRIDQFAHLHHLGKAVDVHAGTLPDFRAGRRRQDGLHVDALGRKFQVQPLREEQYEGLGGAVDRHTHLGRKAHDRADVDDCAGTGLREARSNGGGEPCQCGGIERDQAVDALRGLLHEAARLRHAGVVDQNADA